MSWTARRAAAITVLILRNTIGTLMMVKYREASCRIACSAPIHPGINGLKAMETRPSTRPELTARKRACWDSLRISSLSPAPSALEIRIRTAVPMAPGILLISQVIFVVILTAAVAFSPSCPTMDVSTYCSSVAMICSMMVGTERTSSVCSVGRQADCDPFFILPFIYSWEISVPKYFSDSSES